MLSTPLPVPNRSGGSDALPAPSSDGIASPTPRAADELSRQQVGQVGGVDCICVSTAPATPR